MATTKKTDLDLLREFATVSINAGQTKLKPLSEQYRNLIGDANNKKAFDHLIENFQGSLSGNKFLAKLTGTWEEAIAKTLHTFYVNAGYNRIYSKKDILRIAQGEASLLSKGKIPPELEEKAAQIDQLDKQVKELQKVNKGLKEELLTRSAQLEKTVRNLHNLEVSVMNSLQVERDQMRAWKKEPAKKPNHNDSTKKGKFIS
jgi:hypothetical protein